MALPERLFADLVMDMKCVRKLPVSLLFRSINWFDAFGNCENVDSNATLNKRVPKGKCFTRWTQIMPNSWMGLFQQTPGGFEYGLKVERNSSKSICQWLVISLIFILVLYGCTIIYGCYPIRFCAEAIPSSVDISPDRWKLIKRLIRNCISAAQGTLSYYLVIRNDVYWIILSKDNKIPVRKWQFLHI